MPGACLNVHQLTMRSKLMEMLKCKFANKQIQS
jgi:hypothetical protein